MKYKIGDVARILGISPDLLRYYEKKGVVTPEKDENNDYRYYDFWDINFLMDCLWFKNFGFSIEQIADMVRIPEAQTLSALFFDKEAELRATIRRCELLLQRSEEERSDLAKLDSLLYRCEIAQSPELVRYINRVGTDYAKGSGLEDFSRRWLGVLPFNHRYFEMDSASLLPGCEEDYRWGFSISADYAKALDFEIMPPMAVIPSRRCIHTVFRNSGGKGSFSPTLLQYALDWAAQRGIQVFGPIFGVLLASLLENETPTGYFEAWLPIE